MGAVVGRRIAGCGRAGRRATGIGSLAGAPADDAQSPRERQCRCRCDDRARRQRRSKVWFNGACARSLFPARSTTSGAAMNPQARDHPPHDASFPAEPRQPHHPDVHRDDPARVLPDPDRARRSDRDHGRRARHRSGAACRAAEGIRPGSAGARPVRHLHRPGPLRRPRQIDDHAGAGAERVLRAVSGDHRARHLRDPVRAHHRHTGRDAGRGAPQFGVRPRRDGRFAHRLFDAHLLVGAAADPAVFGAARLDAGVRPHLRQVFHRAGDRVPDDRRAALRRRRARSSRPFRT